MKSVSDLCCDAIDAQPIHFDWSNGAGEIWDIVYPSPRDLTLSQIRASLDDVGGRMGDPDPWVMNREDLLDLYDEDVQADLANLPLDQLRGRVVEDMEAELIDGIEDWYECYENAMHEEADRFFPMMNYAYPLPDFHDDAADAQAILDVSSCPLCVVELNGDYWLALTGGGMDLSWDICRAYMLLGYLPPVKYAGDLPRYGGDKLKDPYDWVLKGAIKSCRVSLLWAQRNLERAEDMARYLLGGCPENMPLPVLNDWLIDQGRPEDAVLVRELLVV